MVRSFRNLGGNLRAPGALVCWGLSAGLPLIVFGGVFATPASESGSRRSDVAPTTVGLIDPPGPTHQKISKLARVAALESWGHDVLCPVRLEGIVVAVTPARHLLTFADDSAAALVELDMEDLQIWPGQKLILDGNCVAGQDGLKLCDAPLVNNDGPHNMQERAGSIFLTAGKHSMHLSWFNAKGSEGLEVYYQGPDLPRQRLPDSALSRAERDPAGNSLRWTKGLDYRCYEGPWARVADFEKSAPVKQGAVPNFDIGAATRVEDVGLEFDGYVAVPRDGVYTFSTVSDDGSLLFIDAQAPRVEVIGTNALPRPMPILAGQILREDQENQWSQVEGTVTFVSEESGGLEIEIRSAAGAMHVHVLDGAGTPPLRLLNNRIRARGICRNSFTTDGHLVAGPLTTPNTQQIELVELSKSDAPSNSLPLLSTVEGVKRLSREEAERGYPVKIRGVITSPQVAGFFIQDATWAIYVRLRDPAAMKMPRLGEYWEVEGTTFVEFAPNVWADRLTRLGTGTLPEPLHPTWDQLINGSLDTQYVEVQGIATAVDADGMTMLTRSGKIKLQLTEAEPATFKRYEGALIRVRGCVIPARDLTTQQVKLAWLRLSSFSINLDEPAPADPFDTPLKRASDLLLFDPRAGAIQRVKIAGQILHERAGEYFVADGTNGLRVLPKGPANARVGALVETAGFPELGGPSPVLREAVMRSTGSASLPAPKRLAEATLVSASYDASRVQVQARLTGLAMHGAELVMELQSGGRGFVARLQTAGAMSKIVQPGSLLELTGVYVAQGGDRASGRGIDSFELLLNSLTDIRVLERPPWWTLRHTLTVVGGMASLMIAALVWIRLLRRQVEERTRQLAAEIRRREQTERQRAFEEERTRIARDLHDDLGATLTQIRFLSALESRDKLVPEVSRGRMAQVSEKSLEMVASLDEIVWAVNPAHDSLPSLATYLCQFAEEFFRSSPVRCRLDIQDTLPRLPLSSEMRHNLYLTVREALNNVAKHAQATEVWLRIHWRPEQLSISIEDNGRGFSHESSATNGEGLMNMRRRMEKMGGRFVCETVSGSGTVCRIEMPFTGAVA